MVESVDMIIRQPGNPERVVRLHEGVTRLGRAEDNDVVLSDVGVSRRHARVVVSRDSVRVEDLGSGNGTYYRGLRVDNQQLEDGDELVIDPFVIQFRIRGSSRRTAGEMTVPGEGMVARLDVMAGAGLSRSAYTVGVRGLTIGRSETRDVVIPDPAASRHHCSVLAREGGWLLRDMGSANGTFLNGVRVRESLLGEGDRIRIGNTEFRFTAVDVSQHDSATQQMPSGSWPEADSAWTQSDVSLPAPDYPTPQGARERTSGGVPRWVGLGLGAVVGAAALLGCGVTVVAGILYLAPGPEGPTMPTAGPPVWGLALPAGLPEAEVRVLQEEGMAALRRGENREALQHFYRVLQAEPGKPSAERLAFAAGEFLLVDGALGPELAASVQKRRETEAERDRLLAQWARGGRFRVAANRALEANHRHDPVVRERVGWDPGPDDIKAQELINQGAEALDEERWADAAEAFAEALELTHDPTWRRTARGNLRAARRELARQVANPWREGVLAERAGDHAAARRHYAEVLELDPSHASVRIRLERLDAS